MTPLQERPYAEADVLVVDLIGRDFQGKLCRHTRICRPPAPAPIPQSCYLLEQQLGGANVPIVHRASSSGNMEPCFVCDICQQSIIDLGDGNALWGNVLDKTDQGGIKSPMFAHKVTCTDVADKRHGVRHFWIGLNDWLSLLLFHYGLKVEKPT